MQLLIFGILGMGMCQYTYFNAILLAGAGIATVLQYLAPSMIILYAVFRYGKHPTRGGEVISVILALVGGIICLIGNDGFSAKSIRLDVLVWGALICRRRSRLQRIAGAFAGPVRHLADCRIRDVPQRHCGRDFISSA